MLANFYNTNDYKYLLNGPARLVFLLRRNQTSATPIKAKPAKPPTTPPAIAPVLLFLDVATAVGVVVAVPVGVGTLLAVGRKEDKLVGLAEVLDVVLVLDVVVGGIELNSTPVNTCCKSMSEAIPVYVVSTVVAQSV